MDYITNETIREYFEDYLDISDKLNKSLEIRCYHLVLKSVIDELSHVLSTYLGLIIDDMRKKLQIIVPKKTDSLSMKQLVDLLDYMNSLEERFPKQAGLIRFLKENLMDEQKNYQSLWKIEERREVFSQMLKLKNRFNIRYFDLFFGDFFNYFDPTEDFVNEDLKEEYKILFESVFKGGRTNRNFYDNIHLYSCFIFAKQKDDERLMFTTLDKRILGGTDVFALTFQIITIQDLVLHLTKQFRSLPDKSSFRQF